MSHGRQDGGDTPWREAVTARTTGMFLRVQRDPAPVIFLVYPSVWQRPKLHVPSPLPSPPREQEHVEEPRPQDWQDHTGALYSCLPGLGSASGSCSPGPRLPSFSGSSSEVTFCMTTRQSQKEMCVQEAQRAHGAREGTPEHNCRKASWFEDRRRGRDPGRVLTAVGALV